MKIIYLLTIFLFTYTSIGADFGIFIKSDTPFIEYSTLDEIGTKAEFISEFELERVHDFPIRPSLRLDLGLWVQQDVFLGLMSWYHSTGLSLHYGDYSGEIRSNLIFDNFGIGFTITKFFELENKIKIGIGLDFGLLFKQTTFEDKITIFKESNSIKDSWKDAGYFIQPNIYLSYDYKIFIFGVSLSLNMDFNKNIYDEGKHLESITGLRVGIFVGLNNSN